MSILRTSVSSSSGSESSFNKVRRLADVWGISSTMSTRSAPIILGKSPTVCYCRLRSQLHQAIGCLQVDEDCGQWHWQSLPHKYDSECLFNHAVLFVPMYQWSIDLYRHQRLIKIASKTNLQSTNSSLFIRSLPAGDNCCRLGNG